MTTEEPITCLGIAVTAEAVETDIRFRSILTNVECYERRIQVASNIQGRKMQRRAEFLLTCAFRKAGWK